MKDIRLVDEEIEELEIDDEKDEYIIEEDEDEFEDFEFYDDNIEYFSNDSDDTLEDFHIGSILGLIFNIFSVIGIILMFVVLVFYIINGGFTLAVMYVISLVICFFFGFISVLLFEKIANE